MVRWQRLRGALNMPAMQKRKSTQHTLAQHGVSLVELMIGSAIGLLISAAALAALPMVRSLTSSVTELTQMQQQAAHAFRVIGQQLRQAGSRALMPIESSSDIAQVDNQKASTLQAVLPIEGSDHPNASQYALTVRLQNFSDKTYPANSNGSFPSTLLLRNCLGENPSASNAVLSSSFKLLNNNLVCAGTAAAQVVIPDVTDLHIRYLLEQLNGGSATYRYVSASELHDPEQWLAVRAVEVCLEIIGQEPQPSLPATYRKCDGSLAQRGDRLQMVFRQHYYLPNRLWTLHG